MILPLMKYALPLLTGYMIFLIISGKFYPFKRPQSLLARPSWVFGLWCGLATSAVMLLVLLMVNPLALGEIKALLPSALALLTLVMIPGILICNWYRSLIAETALSAEEARSTEYDELDVEMRKAMDEPQDQLPSHYDLNDTMRPEEFRDDSDETLKLPPTLADEPDSTGETTETDYDSAFEREYNRLFGVSQNSGTDTLSNEETDSDVVTEVAPVATGAIAPPQLRWPGPQTEYDHAFTVACNSANDYLAARALELEVVDSGQKLVEEYNDAFETARTQTYEAVQTRAAMPRGLDEEASLRQEIWKSAYVKIDAITADFQNSLAKAKSLSRAEQVQRIETETHLRITRRALSRLESRMRGQQSVEASELIQLEDALEEKIRIAAKAESALTRELKNRAELEAELLTCKESELAARRDARRNTAARAKVLATANKALAFARQTVDARTRAEAEIARLKEQGKIHQDTISSLIATLDSAKSKSREEVSFLSKQLLQKEIELEKQSLTGGILTSRLVKKVARARPVT